MKKSNLILIALTISSLATNTISYTNDNRYNNKVDYQFDIEAFEEQINKKLKKNIKSKLSNNKQYIVSLSKKGILTIFDLISKRIKRIKKQHIIRDFQITYSSDKIILSYNNIIEIIDTDEATSIKQIKAPDEITSFHLSKNNEDLVFASLCGQIIKYNLVNKQLEVLYNYPISFIDWDTINKIKINKDSSLVSFSTNKHEVSLLYLDVQEYNKFYINANSLKEKRNVFIAMNIDLSNINIIKLSDNNQYLYIANNNELKIFNLKNSNLKPISYISGANIDQIKIKNHKTILKSEDSIVIFDNKTIFNNIKNKKSIVFPKPFKLTSKDLLLSKDKNFLIEICKKSLKALDLRTFKSKEITNGMLNEKERLILPYYNFN